MLESFSKRMIDFSKIEDHVGVEGDFSFKTDWDEAEVDFFVTSKNLIFTKLLFSTLDETPKRAIYHSLCKLLENSDIDRMKSFSSRELDSFLRDENHVPCMTTGFPDEEIKKFTSKLLAVHFESLLESEVDDWSVVSTSTYIDKIRAIDDFLAIKVNVLEQFSSINVDVNLVHLTNEMIYVELKSSINGLKLSPTTIDKEMILALERVMRRIIGSENIILVAE